MTAARKRPAAPALDLFAAPPRPRPVEVPAPEPEPEPEMVEAPLARRDFASPVERIRLDGHRCVTRTKVYSGNEYRAWERSDVHFYGDSMPGDPAYGRIDTRIPAGQSDAEDFRAAIERQLACQAEARAVIREACPETRLLTDENAVRVGVYDGPAGILLTVDPECRFLAAPRKLVPRG